MQKKKGLMLLPGSLSDEHVWTHQYAAFRNDYAVYRPHLAHCETLEEMAREALSALEGPFALAGFSMGGRVAIEMMRLSPERIERLALIDSSTHPIGEGEAEKRQGLIDLAKQEGMAAVAEEWLPRIVRVEKLRDPEFKTFLKEMMCRFTPDDYEREVRALLTRPDARPVIEQIKCPALILAGRDDPLSTPQRNEALAAQIPHAKLIIFDDCSHFPMLEYPEKTTDALRCWLEGY